MRLIPIAQILCWLLLAVVGVQAQGTVKKTRILFLLDGSSSMTLSWNDANSRYNIASRMLLQLIDSIYAVNNEVEFAVRSVGTQYPAQDKNCQDTRLEVPFNLQNVNQIKTRMTDLRPIGYSPIAYSLRMAADNELNNPQVYDYSVIFITDGGESCGGDVCETFKRFLAGRMKVKPYVIGLNKNEQLQDIYQCLGNYVDVTEPDDIANAIKVIVDANRLIIEKPKQYNLNTTYSNVPPLMPVAPVKSDNTAIARTPDIALLLKVTPPVLRREQILMKAMRRSYPTKESVVFRFDPETPMKPIEPSLQRMTDVFPKLASHPYNYTWKKLTIGPGKKYMASMPNVTLYFEQPVQRETNYLANLTQVDYRMAKMNTIVLKANKIKPSQRKVTLDFPIERPPPDSIPRLLASMPPLPNNKPVRFTTNTINRNQAPVTLVFESDRPEPEIWPTLRYIKFPMRYSYAFRLPEKMKKLDRPAITLKFEMDKPPKKDSVVKKPTQPLQNGDLDFTVETENSDQTQVQVYFKGPNGKAYLNAKPEIEFRELGTNTLKHSFRRLVNNGEPVPQLVNQGNYNVVVTGYTDLYARNVTIQPNKINKVYINVTDGTLTFAYIGNRNRGMEFNAVVNRRFASDPTIIQKCTDRRNYDPGTYYVEITTLPVSKFSIELTFGAVYEIQIPEPGNLQITNTKPVGLIQLQSVLGDGFATFKTMTIKGNTSNQQLTLQPGPYKAIVPINPSVPQLGTKEIHFRIQSNKTTELEIQ
jgi:hypothetical protein